MGGEAWKFWDLGPDGSGKGGIRDTLIGRQDKGAGGRPGQKGSFEGDEHTGGRLGATLAVPAADAGGLLPVPAALPPDKTNALEEHS